MTSATDLVVLPPQNEISRRWATRLAAEMPAVNVIVPETETEATQVLEGGVRAAFGTMTPALLRAARGLERLQAPMAAPEEGYFFDALLEHPVVVDSIEHDDHTPQAGFSTSRAPHAARQTSSNARTTTTGSREPRRIPGGTG